MKPAPPHIALKFLRWFCREDYLDEVEGDLIEIFESQYEKSPSAARRKFVWTVIRHFRPEFIKVFNSIQRLNSLSMLLNYLKVSWRNLTNNRLYSSIKIGGFSTGIAACLLIALFVHKELAYDTHYQKHDRIFRVIRENTWNGDLARGAHHQHPFAAALAQDYPEVELAGRCNPSVGFGAGSNEVRRIDRTLSQHEESIAFADQSLLSILEADFVVGNPEKALVEPNTVVITESIAEKYFRDEDAINKVLILNNDESKQLRVTGVVRDFPITSHFRYQFLISLAEKEFYEGEASNWRNQNYLTYIRVHPEADAAALEQKLGGMVEKYLLPASLENGVEDDIKWTRSTILTLQPVKDIYLNLNEIGDGLTHGDIRFIWLFAAVGLFILAIACMNFVNLSTAKSANRAKEVGLRKVIGSNRSHLIWQFLTESILLSAIAHVFGVILALISLPYFNELLGTELIIPESVGWPILILFGSILFTGVLAGIYPAFFLSSFTPIKVLKGKISTGAKNSVLRNALVVLQFTISTALIISSVVIYQQMDYILTKKLGFSKDQVLVLNGTHTMKDKVYTFKEELLQVPGVSSATISGYLPVDGTRRNNGGWRTRDMEDHESISGQHWAVDADYLKTLDLEIVKGRDFSAQIASDSQAVIINESLAKALEISELNDDQIYNWLGEWNVIGVVKDFHFESMKKKIRPLGLFIRPSRRIMAVKINGSEVKNTIASVSSVWEKFSPNQPIRYTFLDQQYANMYAYVKRIGSILTLFSALAILIACLGLFALSSFIIQQRGKEISIRMVLGASLRHIFHLLTSSFVGLILLAFVMASPLAWYFMDTWLQDFAYKISLNWTIFLLTGISVLIIAFLTVSYQSIRTATMNPVDNLKSE